MGFVAILLGLAMIQEPVKTIADVAPGVSAGAREDAGRADDAKLPATGASGQGTAASVASMDPTYRIGPEDVLKIDVWKEQDFSTTIPVRADGRISMPLLNDVQVAGLTPQELAANLRGQLLKFVVNPRITVSVTQMNSRKAYVMGQVNRQGIVRLQSNMTVLQAISAAGGLAPFANGKRIYVLRSQAEGKVRLPFNYNAVIKGKHPEQNVSLEPGDTVVVP